MTRSPLRTAALAAPLLLTALALAGCSSPAKSGDAGAAPGAGSAAEASAKAQASAISSAMHSGQPAVAASGPVTTGDQLCALVSPADASTALGSPVSDAGGDSYLNGEPLCGYSGGKRTGSMNQPVIGITVVWGPVSQDPYDPSTMLGTGTAVPVSGVGSKAAANDGGFEALIGDHTLQMVSIGTTTPTHDQLAAFAKLFAAKLS